MQKWKNHSKLILIKPNILVFGASSLVTLDAASSKDDEHLRHSARKLIRNAADALNNSGRRYCVFDFGYDAAVRGHIQENDRKKAEGCIHERMFRGKFVRLDNSNVKTSAVPPNSILFRECVAVTHWISEQTKALNVANGSSKSPLSLDALAVIITNTREHLCCLLSCLCSCMLPHKVVKCASDYRALSIAALPKMFRKLCSQSRTRSFLASMFGRGSDALKDEPRHRVLVGALASSLYSWSSTQSADVDDMKAFLLPGASSEHEWEWKSLSLRRVSLSHTPLYNPDCGGCCLPS